MHLLLFYVWRNLKKYFSLALYFLFCSLSISLAESRQIIFFSMQSRDIDFNFLFCFFCCLATNLTWIKLWNRLRSNLDLPESGFALFYSLCCLFVVRCCFLGGLSWLQWFGVLLLDLVAWLHYLINYNVITKTNNNDKTNTNQRN